MKRAVCFLISLLTVIYLTGFSTQALSARSAVVINGDSGEIIYSSNCNERLPMASTTKIMTSLLLCEYGNFEREITVTKEMVSVEGSSMGLLPGDTVTFHDLLYGMMLPSGNDAANTVAISLGGSIDGFVERMNKRASLLGLKDTHFATPSGLDGQDHYTTAYELALITKEAFKNEEFAKAAASESAQLFYGNPPYRRTLTNHNKLLKSYDDVVGVKTGFTKKAGRCLVSAARRDEKFVIAVTLNDPNDWADHRALLDIGLSSLEVVSAAPEISKVAVPLIGADKDSIDIEFCEIKTAVLKGEEVQVKVNLPKYLYAPVKKGEKIGSINYYNADEMIFCDDIVSPETVVRNNSDRNKKEFIHILKYMLCCI